MRGPVSRCAGGDSWRSNAGDHLLRRRRERRRRPNGRARRRVPLGVRQTSAGRACHAVFEIARFSNHRVDAACRSMAFPVGDAVYRSRFLPRFLGIWLAIAGVGYILLSFSGILLPEYQNKVFLIFQPAFLGEIALTLWLVIRGASPPKRDPAESLSAAA